MIVTLDRLKNAVKDIKEDNDWVKDSHETIYYNGMTEGLDRLIRHFEELEYNSSKKWVWVYGDECDFIWKHFNMPDRDNFDRIKLQFVEYESEVKQALLEEPEENG